MKRHIFLGLVLLATPLAAEVITSPVTFNKIQTYLAENPKANSIETLLAALPPEFRKFFVAAYKSRSAQSASPSFPRFILFEKDSTFALALSGDPNSENYQRLETVEFDLSSKAWVFREIKFPSIPGDQIVISEDNPKRCANCHDRQGVMRPIWDIYNKWPGFYSRISSPDSKATSPQHTFELAQFEKFRNQLQRAPGRYTSVVDPMRIKPWDLVANPEVAENGFKRRKTRDEIGKLRLFGKGLLYHNFQRVISQLRENPKYLRFKYALVAALANCDPIEDLLPPQFNLRMKNNEKSFPEIKKSSEESMRRVSLSVQKRLGIEKGDEEYKENGPVFSERQEPLQKARYVLLASMDRDIYDWFLTKEPEIGLLELDPYREGYLLDAVLQDVKAEAPSLEKYFKTIDDQVGRFNFRRAYVSGEHREALCKELKAKSLEKFMGLSEIGFPKPAPEGTSH